MVPRAAQLSTVSLRSNISGVTMLAVPSDIYAYGTQIAVVAFLGFPIVFVVVYLFLPVFYKLQYESSYEVCIQYIGNRAPAVRKREGSAHVRAPMFQYLEHRFHKRIRTLSSVLATVGGVRSESCDCHAMGHAPS